jgi:hypothetical protein
MASWLSLFLYCLPGPSLYLLYSVHMSDILPLCLLHAKRISGFPFPLFVALLPLSLTINVLVFMFSYPLFYTSDTSVYQAFPVSSYAMQASLPLPYFLPPESRVSSLSRSPIPSFLSLLHYILLSHPLQASLPLPSFLPALVRISSQTCLGT